MLGEVSAGVEFVFSVVDQTDNAMPEISEVVFLGQVEFMTLIDGVPLGIGDDFDERAFGIRLVYSRLKYDRQFVRLQHDQTTDGEDADTVDEEFEQYRVE